MSRRTSSWLKIKCLGNEEFVIGGYRVSDKKGRSFASLLLGEFEDGKLHYRGRVGTGFDGADLDDLGAQFAKLRRQTTPFVDIPRAIARDAHWVEPKLVAQIAFTERTTRRPAAPSRVPRVARRQAGEGRSNADGDHRGQKIDCQFRRRRTSPA